MMRCKGRNAARLRRETSIKATCSGLESESFRLAISELFGSHSKRLPKQPTGPTACKVGRTESTRPRQPSATFFWPDMPLAQVLMRIVGRPLVEFKKPEPPVDNMPKVRLCSGSSPRQGWALTSEKCLSPSTLRIHNVGYEALVIRRRFCTAAPAAPLPRLSRTALKTI